ncbi:sigma 54-interacting transcriptional regulator [Desulfurispora thermophila]|uniref:sigma 54-interacting transcriptional regulator n=1 Tax=Desulfurispora thermophila TaxID=265470 RepID=UPI00037DD7AC|nr:sigma 54-interacting transcriptional regulator [Desulfurispora thermophila]
MPRIRVAVIGAGQEGLGVLKSLLAMPEVEIAGMASTGQNSITPVMVDHPDVFITSQTRELLARLPIDVIILTSTASEVRNEVFKYKPEKATVVELGAVDLFKKILREKEELLEFKRMQGELSAILNSVQEAIEVVDNNGFIKYVNPAFTRITGIPEQERIGKNIFQVSPEGALAMALKSGQSVFGHRTRVGGSNAEVISNASPIFIDGKMEGAVVVFQHFTDVMKLLEELKQRTSMLENLAEKLGQATTSKYAFTDIIGQSAELKKCITVAERAARSHSTVLLLGESGTGKELFAHAIHSASSRRDKPFIKVNCAAIPENLLESEFFGYAKGAFTGAVKSKIGKFELANGGTIFLDEIGDMNLHLQGKLLRVLQEMEFERVGDNKTIKVDVRVIAATNRNLRELIRQGKFREDLYYRLNVVEITIPPLRNRKEDLPLLVGNLIVKLNRKLGKKVKGLSKEAEEILYNYDWPGNVRELENVIERVMVTVDEDVFSKKSLLQHINQFKGIAEKDIDIMPIEQMEQLLIKKAIAKFGNTVEGKRKAAQALNISLATLYNKLKKSKIE